MKTFEKVQQLQQSKQFSDKQVYTAINMAQQTYSSKKRGLRRFTDSEKRSLEKFFGVKENYLNDDDLPLPVSNFTRQELINILLNFLQKFIGYDQRLAYLETALLKSGKRKKRL